MMDRKLEILKYETSEHHRQKLRSHIDQKMIDGIELTHNPSSNYQKAYRSLYHDELEKTLSLHQNKKEMENVKKNY